MNALTMQVNPPPSLLGGYNHAWGTDACLTNTSPCADPSTCFYWDSFHPTLTTHAAIAKYAARAIGVPEPAALALLLLLGLGGLAASARRRKLG